MNDTPDQLPVTALEVGDADRMRFLPVMFGNRLFLRGETLVYAWLGKLAPSYSGAFWRFYTLTNGGCYMAPDLAGAVRVEVFTNGFEGDLSADAAGIVATLFALCQLAEEAQGSALGDAIIERYHLLREYAAAHAEAGSIFAAID